MIQIQAIVSGGKRLGSAQQKQLRRCRRALHKMGPLPQAEEQIAEPRLPTRAVGIRGMPALAAVV